MAGLTCEQMTDQLDAHVRLGTPLDDAAQEHLRHCAGCRAELQLLRDLQLALLEDHAEVEPPPALRADLLARARTVPVSPGRRAGRPRSAPRRWAAALSSAAIVTGVLATLAFLTPSRGAARVLPDPAVVVTTGRDLLVASNDRAGTLTVLRGDRVQGSVTVSGRQTPWFTEGVRLGDRIFLADAANDRVLEVRPWPLQVLRVYPVRGGVAGLTAVNDAGGARVYFKGAQGNAGLLGGREVTLAREAPMPLADVMDGVLMLGGSLYVTHHLSGEVCALDPVTLAVQRRIQVGGAPVALAAYRGDLLVLDVTGRLLQVRADGREVRRWTVPGHPDKFSLNDTTALLSDRGGFITRVPLEGGPVTQMPLPHPMDVTPLPGGSFAVAQGARGLRVLNADLHPSLGLDTHGRSE